MNSIKKCHFDGPTQPRENLAITKQHGKDLVVEDSFDHKSLISKLMKAQRFAVLSTNQDDGHPYASLVAFCYSYDLRHVIFCTLRSTKKFVNISTNPLIAMLIDNRCNDETDLEQASAVTVLGTCGEIKGEDRSRLAAEFIERHQAMAGFVNSEDCALMKVKVRTYFLVTKFENVIEIKL